MTLFTFPRFVICPENFRHPPSTNQTQNEYGFMRVIHPLLLK